MKTEYIETVPPGGHWFTTRPTFIAAGFRALYFGLSGVIGYETTTRHGLGVDMRFASLGIAGKHGAREDMGLLAVSVLKWTGFIRVAAVVGRWTPLEEVLPPGPAVDSVADDGLQQKGDYE